MSIVLHDKHFSIAATEDIVQICEPLKLLSVHHFHYIKNFQDGSQINFSTKPDWIQFFFKKSLYKFGKYERSPDHYSSGFAFWNCIVPKKISECACQFGLEHGITLILKEQNDCEFFCFSNAVPHEKSIEFSLGNLSLLQKFVLYFKDRAAPILKMAHKYRDKRILIPHHYSVIETDNENLPIVPFNYQQCGYGLALRKQFLHFIQDVRFNTQLSVPNLGKVFITNKELQCGICLMQGKTAEETGEILLCSRRTVETHLENMKSKCGCYTKKELKVILKSNIEIVINH
jgi:LuxR family transcriptional regulator, quorum-sensing system regulator SolR